MTQVMYKSSDFRSYFGENSCTLVSIAIASGLPKEFVFERAHRVIDIKKLNQRGLYDHEFFKVMNSAGVPYVNRTREIFNERSDAAGKCIFRVGERFFMKHIAKPGKTYIVMNRDHAWCVKDGVCHDPYYNNPEKMKRHIFTILEIL